MRSIVAKSKLLARSVLGVAREVDGRRFLVTPVSAADGRAGSDLIWIDLLRTSTNSVGDDDIRRAALVAGADLVDANSPLERVREVRYSRLIHRETRWVLCFVEVVCYRLAHDLVTLSHVAEEFAPIGHDMSADAIQRDGICARPQALLRGEISNRSTTLDAVLEVTQDEAKQLDQSAVECYERAFFSVSARLYEAFDRPAPKRVAMIGELNELVVVGTRWEGAATAMSSGNTMDAMSPELVGRIGAVRRDATALLGGTSAVDTARLLAAAEGTREAERDTADAARRLEQTVARVGAALAGAALIAAVWGANVWQPYRNSTTGTAVLVVSGTMLAGLTYLLVVVRGRSWRRGWRTMLGIAVLGAILAAIIIDAECVDLIPLLDAEDRTEAVERRWNNELRTARSASTSPVLRSSRHGLGAGSDPPSHVSAGILRRPSAE